jgi:hypothetical protein
LTGQRDSQPAETITHNKRSGHSAV